MATGRPLKRGVGSRRSDGQYRWQLDRGVPLRDEDGNIVKWYGVTTDIEDRKRAEDKIREQESELRQIVDVIPQLVAVFGTRRERPYATVFGAGRERLYANRILLDYLGITLEEWLQRVNRYEFLHPVYWERVTGHSDRARSGCSGFEMELRLRC